MSRPAPPLAPETVAVLACAQWAVHERRLPRLRSALAACPSPERLCAEAARHRMLGHLERGVCALGDAAPGPQLREVVTRRQVATGARCLQQTARLLAMVEELEGRGIPVMPIKGPAWGQRLYGDPALRNWTDLDLMVPYRLAPAAREVLFRAGFLDAVKYNERVRRLGDWAGKAVHLALPGEALNVDLHWAFGFGYSPHVFTAERLLGAGVTGSLLGRPVREPDQADLCCMLAVHGCGHAWTTVEPHLALAVLLRRIEARAWPGVLAVAREAGCERRLVLSAAHVCRVLGLRLPALLAERLAEDGLLAASLAWLAPRLLAAAEDPVESRMSTLLWWLATEDSPRAAARHLLVRAALPGPHEWDSAPELPPLAWRHFAYRPLRLVRRWWRA